jgi:hypothetical protein
MGLKMNQNMQKHIRIISMTVIVLGVLCLILAGVVGVIGLMAIKNQANSGDLDLFPSAITGAIILIPLISIGVLHILTGRAFREGAGWARIVMWILAIINLGNIPIGTGIAIYAIWILRKTREDVK